MLPIVLVICVAVFTVAALICAALAAGPSKPVKQRLEAFSWKLLRSIRSQAPPISGIKSNSPLLAG